MIFCRKNFLVVIIPQNNVHPGDCETLVIKGWTNGFSFCAPKIIRNSDKALQNFGLVGNGAEGVSPSKDAWTALHRHQRLRKGSSKGSLGIQL